MILETQKYGCVRRLYFFGQPRSTVIHDTRKHYLAKTKIDIGSALGNGARLPVLEFWPAKRMLAFGAESHFSSQSIKRWWFRPHGYEYADIVPDP